MAVTVTDSFKKERRAWHINPKTGNKVFIKTKDEKKTYLLDWENRLNGDTLSTGTPPTFTGHGVTVDASSTSSNITSVTITGTNGDVLIQVTTTTSDEILEETYEFEAPINTRVDSRYE